MVSAQHLEVEWVRHLPQAENTSSPCVLRLELLWDAPKPLDNKNFRSLTSYHDDQIIRDAQTCVIMQSNPCWYCFALSKQQTCTMVVCFLEWQCLSCHSRAPRSLTTSAL